MTVDSKTVPAGSEPLAINLEDDEEAKYSTFGTALKKIVGLDASDE